MTFRLGLIAALASLAGLAVLLLTFERPPVQVTQLGYRGVGMEAVANPRTIAINQARHTAPPVIPEASPDGDRASSIYENVPLLGHLSIEQFGRVMQAMSEWIYPGEGETQGCNGCHVPGNFAAEGVYQKTVARRMIQMVQAINTEYSTHVGATGVTCYTCHRGQAVPAAVWSAGVEDPRGHGMAAVTGGQNQPTRSNGLSSLPHDGFSPYFFGDQSIRQGGTTPLAGTNRASIGQTEWTYGLMMHMSTGLGVNCTFCHNTRNFADWEYSSPQRVTAWHGIRMVRAINTQYIEPLRPVFPANRLGPHGDTLKANCTTCHQGVARPLNGAQMLRDYPELRAPPRSASN